MTVRFPLTPWEPYITQGCRVPGCGLPVQLEFNVDVYDNLGIDTETVRQSSCADLDHKAHIIAATLESFRKG